MLHPRRRWQLFFFVRHVKPDRDQNFAGALRFFAHRYQGLIDFNANLRTQRRSSFSVVAAPPQVGSRKSIIESSAEKRSSFVDYLATEN